MSANPPPIVPVRIHADRDAGRLEIEWQDGHETTYDTITLRWLCPCAYCRGEAGMPGWLDSKPQLTDQQTRPAADEPMIISTGSPLPERS